MAGLFIIFATVSFSLYILIKRVDETKRDIRNMAIGAYAVWILNGGLQPFLGDLLPLYFSEVILMLVFSMLLSALLMLVRYLRPVLFQYPNLLTFSPFLIAVFFLLVKDTYLIKDIMFMSVQAVIVIVSLLIILGMEISRDVVVKVLAATLFLVVAFIFYWFSENFIFETHILWPVLLSAGILIDTLVLTSDVIMNNNPNKPKEL